VAAAVQDAHEPPQRDVHPDRPIVDLFLDFVDRLLQLEGANLGIHALAICGEESGGRAGAGRTVALQKGPPQKVSGKRALAANVVPV
jgi:hypothetical protein